MTEVTFTPEPEPKSFSVFFGGSFSIEQNADLMGAGELVIYPTGTALFRGTRRKLLVRRPAEMEFTTKDRAELKCHGRQISFETYRGRGGKEGKPFVFWVEEARTAQEIAPLLDPAFVPSASGQIIGNETKLSATLPSLTSVTGLLVLVNTCVFLAMTSFMNAGWFNVQDLMPYIQCGANNGAATTGGQWWRLLTCQFIHYGVLHLVFNMWALLKVGNLLERLLGRLNYLLIYITAGAAGGLASIFIHRDQLWSAGASGAIFGLYGTLLAFSFSERRRATVELKSLYKSTLLFVGYNLLYGLANPVVDVANHVGGFVAGFALGLVSIPSLAEEQTQSVRRQKQWQCGLAAALIVSLGATFAPRFDYKMDEAIALRKLAQDYTAEEHSQVEKFQAAERNFQRQEIPLAEFRSDAQEIVGFYERWSGRFRSLELTANSQTASQRQSILTVLQTARDAVQQESTRASAFSALEELGHALDAQVRKLVETQAWGNSWKATASEARSFALTLRSQISAVEDGNVIEIRIAKNQLLARVSDFEAQAHDLLTEVQGTMDFQGTIEQVARSIREKAKLVHDDPEGNELDYNISVLREQVIPSLRQADEQLSLLVPHSEQAARTLRTLQAEVTGRLRGAQIQLERFAASQSIRGPKSSAAESARTGAQHSAGSESL